MPENRRFGLPCGKRRFPPSAATGSNALRGVNGTQCVSGGEEPESTAHGHLSRAAALALRNFGRPATLGVAGRPKYAATRSTPPSVSALRRPGGPRRRPPPPAPGPPRTPPAGLALHGGGQPHGEEGAPPRHGPADDGAAMGRHDPLDERQPQPEASEGPGVRAVALGEVGEGPLPLLGRHPLAVVEDAHLDRLGLAVAGGLPAGG